MYSKCDYIVNIASALRRKQKIAVFPLTRPSLSFCADPAVFITNKNKIRYFHADQPSTFEVENRQ